MTSEPRCPFVTRGGLKLRHALDTFAIDPRGLRCVDFGCNVGGFTDCLLQAGAGSVVAIDTGYGSLAWRLRQDPRVRVMERTNALHAPPPTPDDQADLAVVDMGWTPQRLCVPAALRWIKSHGRIVSLIKPHYELDRAEASSLLVGGVLAPEHADRTARRTIDAMPALGARVVAVTRSPILGGASKKNPAGNTEFLALLARA